MRNTGVTKIQKAFHILYQKARSFPARGHNKAAYGRLSAESPEKSGLFFSVIFHNRESYLYQNQLSQTMFIVMPSVSFFLRSDNGPPHISVDLQKNQA
jgi:hypothetical protein